MTSWSRLVVITALTLVAGSAHAQDKASDLVDRGLRAADTLRWDDAIAAYEQAYALEPEPDILGLLGDAYRGKQDCARAAESYQNNLSLKPKARRKKELAQRVAEMKACAARQADEANQAAAAEAARKAEAAREAEEARKAEAARKAEGGAAPPLATNRAGAAGEVDVATQGGAAEPPSSGSPGRGKRIAGISIAGAGAVALGIGIVFGLDARAKAREVEAYVFDNGNVWDAHADDLEARGQRRERLGVIFLTAGTVAVVGGGLLWYLGARGGSEGRPVARIGAHDALGGWAWAF